MSTPVEIIKKIVIVLALIYVTVHTYMNTWQPVLTFILVLILSKVLNIDTSISFLSAMLISYASYDLINMEVVESFESSEDEEEEKDEIKVEEKKVEEKKVEEKVEESGVSLDLGETLRDAYAKLTPEQLTSMTNETKELMKTQTELMKTLEGLTPIVEGGMNIIQKFSGKTGGNSSIGDLINNLSPKK